jgi:hypothetical protein
MLRRGFSTTLLLLLAIQLLGTVAFAAVCLEPCPDDTDDNSCPPVCSLCTTCTHAQQAIMQATGTAVPLLTMPHVSASRRLAKPSGLSADIFHIPLLG